MTAVDPRTRAVRAGIATDGEHGAVVPPIHLSSNFSFAGFGRPRPYDYTRSGNPTRTQLADAIADLEGGAGASVTCTGMSAVALALQLVPEGGRVVAAHDAYGGTQRLLNALAARGRIALELTDLTAAHAPDAVRAARPQLVWIETPSNPLLRITDIRAVAAAARDAGALVVVDNTFLSPALQQPLALGADLVVHSTTKYLNGHSDVVGGAVVARDAAVAGELAWWANATGVSGSPFDAWLTLRGVRTLHARMERHLANTDAVVAALCAHPAVRVVHYPGLSAHPGHALARAQQRGFGAMVSFELDGGVPAVERFTGALHHFTLAESLGGVESLVAHPATMTHASMSAEARAQAGIGDALVRLSVGIEAEDDLVRDLVQALDRASRTPAPRVTVTTEPARDVIVLGAGTVGRELLRQLAEPRLAAEFRVTAVVDTTGAVTDVDGIAPERLRELATLKRIGGTLAAAHDGAVMRAEAVIARGARAGAPRSVLVDATAADTWRPLLAALDGGFDVVLANKIPLAGPMHRVDALRGAAARGGGRILHEATVGAGLPVIETLERFAASGDEVVQVDGCPSGTLGFLLAETGRGVAFSTALHAAVANGYTEPDPRLDLSGADVARKALILARMLGFRGELADVEVESLVPTWAAALPLGAFLTRAHELDAAWAARHACAHSRGEVLRYRATVTADGARVGLVALLAADPMASLGGTDNQFAFRTRRYAERPLVVTGPGAGAAVTSAGIIGDLLRLREGPLPARHRPRQLSPTGRPPARERTTLSTETR